ncbi:hypothetical protein KVC81_00745 [Helicobacter pylori]|nr:hypothetical protein KVE78_00730 [Helicobacter pylori]WQR99457.1 hypothetical protein KVC81_00745 [Helicobacter pylori]WQS02272.1 hypothetical protein KVD22_00735 [Helicobacter pylori]
METITLYAGSFILIVKNTQRHQFDYQHSIKNFYRLYKMRWNALCLTLSIAIFQRFLRNKTLSLLQKKPKSLKSKDFKKAVVFKKDSPTQNRAIGS